MSGTVSDLTAAHLGTDVTVHGPTWTVTGPLRDVHHRQDVDDVHAAGRDDPTRRWTHPPETDLTVGPWTATLPSATPCTATPATAAPEHGPAGRGEMAPMTAAEHVTRSITARVPNGLPGDRHPLDDDDAAALAGQRFPVTAKAGDYDHVRGWLTVTDATLDADGNIVIVGDAEYPRGAFTDAALRHLSVGYYFARATGQPRVTLAWPISPDGPEFTAPRD